MQIWHMEPFPCGDRRLPHHVFPPKKITTAQLGQLAGVQYYKVDLDDTASMKKRLSAVKTEKNVTFTDVFTVSETMLDFEDKMDQFYEPQMPNEDVISLVVEGTCYYDVEIEDDSWIRVQVEKGDLIVIPKGLSHRFTTTPQNYVKIQRFFSRKVEGNQG